MMNIDKIVVATDFSPASDTAITQAMHVARHTGAEIMLVHAGAVPEASDVPETSATLEEFDTLVREGARSDRNQLEELRERLDGQGVELSHALIDGFPDQAICNAARDTGAELIVTGTHGRTGFKRFLLGSVAERVVRLAERSVLVARNDSGAGGFGKILVPTDFSELSELAIDWAVTLAAEGAEIELFHCWQLPPGASTRATNAVLQPVLQAVSADVLKRGEKLEERYENQDRTVRFRSVRQTPAVGIQERVEEEDFDLIVMGSHGRRGIQRFFLGSVAEATLRHATCSVLVAHEPPKA